jgi:hypothetical protein
VLSVVVLLPMERIKSVSVNGTVKKRRWINSTRIEHGSHGIIIFFSGLFR